MLDMFTLPQTILLVMVVATTIVVYLCEEAEEV